MEDPQRGINFVSRNWHLLHDVGQCGLWKVTDAKWCVGRERRTAVQTYSCKTTPNWTSEIITDEKIQYQTSQSSLPMGEFKRRELHHPCYLPIYLTGSMQVRKKNCLAALFTHVKSEIVPRCLTPVRPKLHTKKKKKKDLTGSTYCFSPPLRLAWNSSWFRLTRPSS